MTYNVFGGTLNLAQSINQLMPSIKSICKILFYNDNDRSVGSISHGSVSVVNVEDCLVIMVGLHLHSY